MKTLDKVLLSTIVGCCVAIFMIFSSNSFSVESQPQLENDSSYHKLSNISYKDKDKASNSYNEMIIYNNDVDKIIENYFQKIKEHSAIQEEDERLIEDIPNYTHITGSSNQKVIKKNKKQEDKKVSSLYVNYKVKNGDSLWKLSHKFNIPLYTIISANPKKSHEAIHPKENLSIPTKKGIVYHVKKNDVLSKIAQKYSISINKIMNFNNLKTSKLKTGDKIFLPGVKPEKLFKTQYKSLFIWPLRGGINSHFGWRKHPFSKKKHFHKGVDIAARHGTPIHSIGKGVVVFSARNGNYGNLIIVRHKNKYFSAYAHCSKLLKRVGQVVKRGQMIAKVGSTGLSTGSHLHFEIKKGKTPINPEKILSKKVKVKVPII